MIRYYKLQNRLQENKLLRVYLKHKKSYSTTGPLLISFITYKLYYIYTLLHINLITFLIIRYDFNYFM